VVGITGEWDRRISRRTLLRTGGSLAAGVTLAGALSGRALATPPFAGNPFALGVASGDPLPDGVVLWTRLAPDPLVPGGGMKPEPYGVRFELALDEGFRRIVRRGAVEAIPDEAHSVRAEVDGLRPAHEYFYRFKFGREVSPVGRTRTAPEHGATVNSLRFAFVSCQNFPAGYFTAYADVASDDAIDAVVHLGDYIYEGPASDVRPHAPLREIFSLDDYRIRHGQYKTDLDLQAAHAAHPWLVTWDDHEVDNNYAGDESDPDSPPEEFIARRAAAYRAYWEHMPLRRERKPDGAFFNLYRRFRWGNAGDVQRARHAPVPLRPAGGVRARRARSERLLPGRARSGADDARGRAARVAVRGARDDHGALERARAADRIRPVRSRSEPGRPRLLRRGRQLGRLRRRSPAGDRLARRARHAEPGRDHR
jgi:alkaline phosphatase D